jgi:hypothetical protein
MKFTVIAVVVALFAPACVPDVAIPATAEAQTCERQCMLIRNACVAGDQLKLTCAQQSQRPLSGPRW